RLTGTVVDNAGSPVPGATIKVGSMLFTQSGQENRYDNFNDMAGIRTAISDADGTFSVVGIPVIATNVMADHPDRGRSLAVAVPEGADDPPAMTLPLRGFGSITGKVTMQGQPVAGATIGESSKGGTAQGTFTQTSDDGSYSMTRVPEGVHVLNAMRTQMMSLKSTSVTVTVAAGKSVVANIDIPVGQIALTVQIKALPGNKVDAAQVALFKGTVTVDNAKQLSDGFFQSGVIGLKTWLGPVFPNPEFDEIVPDSYSLCTVPFTGNLADPTVQQRIGQNLSALKVYCKAITVTPSPTSQTVTHEVPSMQPLPPT
ncbi:MAG TPA: carboxypeptidase regulatory-like domain-containing protein, partial [Kofleriaceae bacterium]|nr:carboxypeptidase regulatory-like domain-containing protein [Kofleriaceae bacterium]